MSQLNYVEEYFDFIDGPVWEDIAKYIIADAKGRRRLLLTSYTLPENLRFGHIAVLKAYKDLVSAIYLAAGRKLPPELLDIFTGDSHE